MVRRIDPLRSRFMDDVRLLVVKIGSGVLTAHGRLNRRALNRLGREINLVRQENRQVILVSSGAVASGLGPLGLSRMPRAIADKQAAAAVGQQVLMNTWADAFGKDGTRVAQVLLTSDDLDHRTRYLNARHTLQRLLALDVVPVVNENDSVSFEEIKMGDNDHLSALVTILVSAQLLVMLSDVDGLRRGGPHGPLIHTVRPGEAVAGHVAKSRSMTGVGGMQTKVEAAAMVSEAGIPAVIASGRRPGELRSILAGREVGTVFEAHRSSLDPRRRWLATATRPRGVVIVDAGAMQAILERNASLLPSGIIRVEGRFEAGAVVRICDRGGHAFARGLVSYASDEIQRVRGRKGSELPGILGYRYLDEIVHRNDMVVERRPQRVAKGRRTS